jgi:sarcosine oxidase delta subunit
MPMMIVPCPQCGDEAEVWLSSDGDPEDVRPGCDCDISPDDDMAMVETALALLLEGEL